ncbi:MAG: SMP-30/gluconolactonase/LRE family protein [Nitrospirae bacterium]|nr:SMP-30/gluconolactonase/LRE family protein [Nitrospirota bacterium]
MKTVPLLLGTLLALPACGDGSSESVESPLPVTPRTFLSGTFQSAEGITFDHRGRMFVTADKALWEIGADGSTRKVTDLKGPIGLAHDGAGGILVAEGGSSFGPPEPRVKDGTVLKVTSAGDVTVLNTDIPDPNFILVRDDGDLLVSDDIGDEIYLVPGGGGPSQVFLKGITAPNGMVFSLDRRELFVSQSFAEVGTIIPDARVWRVPLDANGSPGAPALLAKLPDAVATNDGVAMDEKGRVYVAANLAGKIYRIDPAAPEPILVVSGVPGVASLAFGRGKGFSETSIHATQLFGGAIFEIPLGIGSAPTR